ncbi:MAG: HlyD family efflux transporter periplasmic adaptor subunit [Tepidisphaeraceae bacterium]|jgi:multidrug efflux pump subunit AcrA (membrane-fusion protein)
MIRKTFLPLVAVAGVIFMVHMVVNGSRPPALAALTPEPSRAPFANSVSGAGIVEAFSENIQVGAVVPGVVKQIFVKVGDTIAKGQPLWQIDERELQADLATKRAAATAQEALLAAAQARYDRLKQMPRPEEIPPAQARADADLHSLEDARDQLRLLQSVSDARAISQDDLDRRRHAVDVAQAHLAESQANLALLRAGSWDQDLKVAAADIQSARAQLQSAQTQVQSDRVLIDRLTVTAPVDGEVLQVKLHVGEYAAAGELETPLMLIGDVRKLVVRTDVDENDAWRVPRNGATRAVAYLRGNREIGCDLKFYRIEPFVVPKKSLTGDSTERVDTRVLQVLYTFDAGEKPIYVGQQMDVFIECAP